MTARVLGVIAAATAAMSRLNVSGSMSTRTALRAAQLHCVRRRWEGVRGDDHLVVGSDLDREEGEVERGRPGRHRCRVRGADDLRHGGLELLDLRAHRELPGVHNLRDGSKLGLPDVRPREPNGLRHLDGFSRYHAIVRSSPSSRSTLASKPSSSRAFSMFGTRTSTSV